MLSLSRFVPKTAEEVHWLCVSSPPRIGIECWVHKIIAWQNIYLLHVILNGCDLNASSSHRNWVWFKIRIITYSPSSPCHASIYENFLEYALNVSADISMVHFWTSQQEKKAIQIFLEEDISVLNLQELYITGFIHFIIYELIVGIITVLCTALAVHIF